MGLYHISFALSVAVTATEYVVRNIKYGYALKPR